MGLGLIATQSILHSLIDRHLVAPRFHVDKIKHDQTAHIAQTELAADLIGRFEVYVDDGGILIFAALMTARVDIDRHQGFGFVDDDVAAALQMDLAGKGAFQLPGDVESIEDGMRIGVMFDLGDRAPGNFARSSREPFVSGQRVDHDAFDVFGQKVADGAADQVRFFKDAGRQRLFADALLNFLPLFEEQSQVSDEVSRLLAFARRSHDDSHAFGDRQAAEDLFQALAFFLVLDFARDSGLIRVRKQDQVTAGQREVGRNTRSFGSDRAFGHLHNDLAAGGIKPWNVTLGNARFVALLGLRVRRSQRRCRSCWERYPNSAGRHFSRSRYRQRRLSSRPPDF